MAVHLFDRPRAFAEAVRVLAADGRVVIASDDPASFDEVWFARFFPSVPAIDAGRFPDAAQLTAELTAAGRPRIVIERLSQERTITRERALDLLESKAYSTFELLEPAEYEAGCAQARAELPGQFSYRFDWLIAAASPG